MSLYQVNFIKNILPNMTSNELVRDCTQETDEDDEIPPDEDVHKKTNNTKVVKKLKGKTKQLLLNTV